MHTPQLSWNWHKGWNLPQISIQIPDSLKTYLSPYGRLKCEIKSIAYSMGKLRNRIPIEVGVTGTTKKILWMGKLTYLGSDSQAPARVIRNQTSSCHFNLRSFGNHQKFQHDNTGFLHFTTDFRGCSQLYKTFQRQEGPKNLFRYLNPFFPNDLNKSFTSTKFASHYTLYEMPTNLMSFRESSSHLASKTCWPQLSKTQWHGSIWENGFSKVHTIKLQDLIHLL